MLDTFVVGRQWERSSGRLTCVLKDETGTPVPKASLISLTLTLYDQNTRAIVNGKRNANVLDQGGVTVGATDGLITWAVSPFDTMLLTSGGANGTHVAIFTAKWGTSGVTQREHSWMVMFPIENLPFTTTTP